MTQYELVVGVPNMSQERYVVPAEGLTLGRSKKADVRLVGDEVSRVHGAVKVHGEDLYIIDFDSRNGISVNGKRIRRNSRLHPGDHVVVGDTKLVVVSLRSKKVPSSVKRKSSVH